MIHIRKAGEKDIPTLVRFNTEMAYETEKITLDRECLQAGVQAAIADPKKGFYFLAESDEGNGQIVGQSMVTLEWSDWRNGYWWWIQSVYVLPEWRQQGVFRQLYQRTLEEAKKAGALGLRLYVEKENGTAQNTYLALKMEASHYQMYEYAFADR